MDTMRTSLYRFFDDDGALLYIGITNCLPARLTQHDQDKKWWTDVTRVHVEHFATRPEALAAEKEAIQSEVPFWNIMHSTLMTTLDKAKYLEPRLVELFDHIRGIEWDGEPDWCPERRWWWGDNGFGHSGVYSRLKLLIGEGRYTSEADYRERGPSLWDIEPSDPDEEDFEDWFVPIRRPGAPVPGLYTVEDFCAQPSPPEPRSLEAWLSDHDLFLEVKDVAWSSKSDAA